MTQNSTAINQGDLYWCEPDPQDTVGSEQEKDRPWIIISKTATNRGRIVVGIPLTRTKSRACSYLIALPAAEIIMDDRNPPVDSVALTDQIRALDKQRLRRKAGHISPKALNAVKLGMEYLFDM